MVHELATSEVKRNPVYTRLPLLLTPIENSKEFPKPSSASLNGHAELTENYYIYR